MEPQPQTSREDNQNQVAVGGNKLKFNYMTRINGKTVYFLGSKCFTEDNIPIYTICLSNFPIKKGLLQIDEEMSQYGETVNIKRIKESKIPKALITFRKPQSASKILMTYESNNSVMKVEPAFSWMQPQSIITKYLIDNDKKDDKYYFDYLPNECLYYMFNYLSFNDHVKLSLMSKNLLNTFKLYYKTKKTFDINRKTINGLTLMQIRQAFIDIGYKIEKINLSKLENDNILFEFILKYCKKIKYLQLTGINFRSRNMRKEISMKLKKLEKLKLIYCKENEFYLASYINDVNLLRKVTITHLSIPNQM